MTPDDRFGDLLQPNPEYSKALPETGESLAEVIDRATSESFVSVQPPTVGRWTLTDKATSIARLAAFLTPGRAPDAAQIAAIAAATGFDAMKEEMTHNPRSFHFSPAVFFRAGTTRDWEGQLSADIVARIDGKSASVWGGDDPTAPPEAYTAGWRRPT